MTPQSTASTMSPPRAVEAPGRSQHDLHPADDLVCYIRDYARQKPDVAALWCFGIGFILGWKLKPW